MGLDDGVITDVAAGVGQGSTNAEVIDGGDNRQRVTIVGEVASFISPSQSFTTGAIIMTGSNALVDIAATGAARNMATDFSPAVILSGENAHLNNAGQITGGSGVNRGGSGVITNAGRISGVGQAESNGAGSTAAGIYLRRTLGDAFRIYNTGLIEGAVQGSGAFYAGRRFVIFTEETTTNGVLVDNDGRLGDDRGNFAEGGTREDSIQGLRGDDILDDGAGSDDVIGGLGSDPGNGGLDDDPLFGSVRADVVYGGLDDDRVLRDRITDFTSGVDVIDLQRVDAAGAIGNQAFTFIGGAQITAQGQLRDVNGTLFGNVTGTTDADFMIELASAPVLVVGDFIL